jgi:hypothetical protein
MPMQARAFAAKGMPGGLAVPVEPMPLAAKARACIGIAPAWRGGETRDSRRPRRRPARTRSGPTRCGTPSARPRPWPRRRACASAASSLWSADPVGAAVDEAPHQGAEALEVAHPDADRVGGLEEFGITGPDLATATVSLRPATKTVRDPGGQMRDAPDGIR